MPSNPQSLRVTDAYRARLETIRATVDRTAENNWGRISTDDLDGTYSGWLETVVPAVSLAQTLSVRATAGYLGAYLTSELGRRSTFTIDPATYSGKSRDGRPLHEALLSPLIGTKGAIKDGVDPSQALSGAFSRAMRTVGLDTDQAARFALQDALKSDDRFAGYQRAVKGTCGACLGSTSSRLVSVETPMHIHPNCKCVAEPVVRGVTNSVPRLTGTEIFRRLTPEEQDSQFGPEKAALLRAGTVSLHDLVATSPQATSDDFITERPLQDLVATP